MTRPASPFFDSPLSRRAALLGLLGAPWACRSGAQHAPSAASAAPALAAAPARAEVQLEVVQVTDLRADERGGLAVVLLHGFGAQGDDLVSLARSLQRPGVRFILPAAPLSLGGGGRAWWRLEAADRPTYVTDGSGDGAAPSNAKSAELERARGGVQALLRQTNQLYAPEQTYLVGFSQGAMLALDVALSGVPVVQRVAVLSGALLNDALSGASSTAHPAVFISHGQEDTRLPFSGAQRMKAELEQRGLNVTWRPFTGGHEIPESVVADLARFLFT